MALFWLCVAVGLTGWAVQRSAQAGRLAAPPRMMGATARHLIAVGASFGAACLD
jgi:hypothetical protein